MKFKEALEEDIATEQDTIVTTNTTQPLILNDRLKNELKDIGNALLAESVSVRSIVNVGQLTLRFNFKDCIEIEDILAETGDFERVRERINEIFNTAVDKLEFDSYKINGIGEDSASVEVTKTT